MVEVACGIPRRGQFIALSGAYSHVDRIVGTRANPSFVAPIKSS